MKTWQKVTFVAILVTAIGLSVFFSFYSIARDTFEYHIETAIGGEEGVDGWVFYGFSGNPQTTSIRVDFVRDKKGENPDESRPVLGVSDFTLSSDEYVEEIFIGKSVRYIDEYAFFYCKKLRSVTVDPANEWYCSVDGVLYTKDMKKLILRPICLGQKENADGGFDYEDSFTVPDSVERIGAGAFYKNVNLIHLEFGTGLREIGNMSFFGCNNMWTIWLPEGLESIDTDAFGYCWSMSPVLYIPGSVKTVGSNAFFNCTGIREVLIGCPEEDIELGEAALPKSLKVGPINKAPKPQYGKSLADALALKEQLDNAAQEG